MGDIADDLIDAGLDELINHKNGECEYLCAYCEEEDEAVLP